MKIKYVPVQPNGHKIEVKTAKAERMALFFLSTTPLKHGFTRSLKTTY